MSTEAAPEHCPGVESESAGKSSACEGCPNQGACSSGSLRGAAGAEAELDLYEIARKLSSVKHILVVMSGKGGVGKSTVASQLARYIAHAAPEANVGLLDVDICGPSIPKAMGVEAEEIFTSASGWSPIFVEENLAVMSCGFLLTSPDDAVIWRGPKKNGIIKQFLRDVDWSGGSGDQGLDYLLIDTPPGTSDEHISLVSYLKHVAGLRGAILVTTPQEVAQADVRKQVDFCRRVQLPIIGVIENMAVFTCPKCHQDSFIFKRSADSGDKLLGDSKEVKLLGRIPLDPLIGKSVDEGVSLFDEQEEERKEGGGGGDLKTEAVRQKTSAKTIAAFKEVWANVQAAITESK